MSEHLGQISALPPIPNKFRVVKTPIVHTGNKNDFNE